jgi:mRNA interferase MazF
VVLQSDHLPLSTAIVAPTSTSARPADFRPEVTVDRQRTRVLVEQMAAVDLSRLGDPVGRLSPEDLQTINQAIRDVLSL